MSIENDYVRLWIEDGILYESFKPDITRVTLKMAREIVHDRLKLSNGTTMPVLIYSNNVKIMDKEARNYFATKEATQYLSASAMLINNYLTWMLSRLFLSFNKPELTVELFRNNKEALEWLRHYKHLN